VVVVGVRGSGRRGATGGDGGVGAGDGGGELAIGLRRLGTIAAGVVAVGGGAGAAAAGQNPADEHLLEDLAFDGLGEVVVHTGFHAFLAVALDGGCGHGNDGDLAEEELVGRVVSDEVRRPVAVDDWHLHIHEDDVGSGVRGVGRLRGDEVV